MFSPFIVRASNLAIILRGNFFETFVAIDLVEVVFGFSFGGCLCECRCGVAAPSIVFLGFIFEAFEGARFGLFFGTFLIAGSFADPFGLCTLNLTHGITARVARAGPLISHASIECVPRIHHSNNGPDADNVNNKADDPEESLHEEHPEFSRPENVFPS